jgi:hypothetical protein
VLLLFWRRDASGCDAEHSGQPKCAAACNLINVITGNKFQAETDLPAMPGVGPGDRPLLQQRLERPPL